MKLPVFTGSGVALATPFTSAGVDFPALKKLVDFQINNGTDAIIVCGTTGEATTMTHEEKMQAIETVVEHTNGRVPVIAGSGANSTETAVHSSKEIGKTGVDGLLVVTPYYNKATQKGLIAHYTAIAESVKLPIIMYNVPSRTGCNIQPQTAAYLAKNVKNIVGIKEASGNISQVAKLMQLADGQIELYSGNDDQVVPLLSLGGFGVISVLSNVAPRETHDMVAKFLEGDLEGSREIQLRAIPLVDQLFCEVNPIPVKAAMNLMGWEVGPLRMPLTDMEPEHVENLKKAMIDFGIEVK